MAEKPEISYIPLVHSKDAVMKKQILDRYTRTADNKLIIDIAAGKVGDLYNDFDRHTPYAKKELDQDLTDYIIDSVSEIGKENFIIQFRLTAAVDMKLMSRVKTSIHNYFLYLKELEIRELARMSRTSLILLSIGVATLSVSVWVNQKITEDAAVIASVFAEGLTVAAWVSLWESLATFLINWAPHRRQIKMYERIAKAPVLFREPAQAKQGMGPEF